MKQRITSTLILGALTLIITGCTEKTQKSEKNKFVITGKFINAYSDSIFFEYGSKKDCTIVKNNAFRFEGYLNNTDEIEGYFRLRNAANPNVVFLNTGKVDVILERRSNVYNNVTYNDIRIREVNGSANHTLWDNWGIFYKKNKDRDKAEWPALINLKLKNTIDSFPKSPINGRMLYLYSNELNLNDIHNIKNIMDTTSMFNNDRDNLNTIIRSKIRTQKNASLKNFVLESQNGTPEKFCSLKNKFTLIDFWASWCGPCREQNKDLRRLAQSYNKTFDIISISFDDDKESWKKAITKDNMHWKNFIVKHDWDSDIAEYYGITSLPFNILVDGKGKIIAVNLSSSEIDSYLK